MQDMSDLDILEFLLGLFRSGEQTEKAYELIGKFGNFAGVFDATREELAQCGLTDRAAVFFTTAKPLYRQALLRNCKQIPLSTENNILKFAIAYLIGIQPPCDYCFFLDADYGITRVEQLTESNRVREIIGYAARYDADKMIWISYKTRTDSLRPDDSKLSVLRKVIEPLCGLGITFLDYIEYSPYSFYSLRRTACGNEECCSVGQASNDIISATEISAMRKHLLKAKD